MLYVATRQAPPWPRGRLCGDAEAAAAARVPQFSHHYYIEGIRILIENVYVITFMKGSKTLSLKDPWT